MKTTINKLSDTKLELTITLGKKELDDAKQVAVTKLSKELKVSGFRQGKVPAEVAIKNIDPAKLDDQLLNDAISKAVADAFIENKLQALERPAVEVKKYVPGEAGGSYMITEEAYTPHIFQVEINGYKAFESRGKWEVKDMYMAGPFLNYTFIDDKNDRLVIVEGLTYAPATKKRDYMFELEAILKTMKID
jgi:FKBP-type peptidyl-prolyl cis-trans isomerase (trigger factor)